ncbi:hypothetical protein EGI32_02385 [Ferruginibacter sp. HRS2-29]|nr:hypothetical protein [Ferruginibacter sp. HRS2-29]
MIAKNEAKGDRRLKKDEGDCTDYFYFVKTEMQFINLRTFIKASKFINCISVSALQKPICEILLSL